MAKKKAIKRPPYGRLPLLGILLIVLLGYLFFTKTDNVLRPSPKEEISQLTSVDKYVGNASATRSYSGGNFKLSITAFLAKPTPVQEYEVRLNSETSDPKTVVLGNLAAAGDVYTLNFEREINYSAYKEILVVLVNTETEKETVLLMGSF